MMWSVFKVLNFGFWGNSRNSRKYDMVGFQNIKFGKLRKFWKLFLQLFWFKKFCFDSVLTNKKLWNDERKWRNCRKYLVYNSYGGFKSTKLYCFLKKKCYKKCSKNYWIKKNWKISIYLEWFSVVKVS